MSAVLNPRAVAPAPIRERDRRRWLILAVVAIAQLMVVLDATIVNIALPQAQAALDMSDGNRQWVVTAYSLAFGGLLLLGGRIADYFGRRRTFVIGAAGFALASALGGAAQSDVMLFAARGLQGVFAALLAPAALSLLTTNFPSGPDRTRAFAVFGAISAGGAALGLLLGGLLVEFLNWRWTLLVNAPIALAAGLAAVRWVPESRAEGTTKYDLPGAATVTLGLMSLVYGFVRAEDGWTSAPTLGFIAIGLLLLGAFVAIERRSSHPLLPLRIPLDRNRGGALLASLGAGAAIMGSFLFLVYYFQVVLEYSPIESGAASLPVTAGVVFAAALAGRAVTRFGSRIVMAAGALAGAGALLWLSGVGLSTDYVTFILPALMLLGGGLGFVFVPLTNLATSGVDANDAGAASALTNSTQQVGASLGTALLNTLYATAVADYLVTHAGERGAERLALVDGYSVAFLWGAGILVAAALITLLVVRGRRDPRPMANALPAMT